MGLNKKKRDSVQLLCQIYEHFFDTHLILKRISLLKLIASTKRVLFVFEFNLLPCQLNEAFFFVAVEILKILKFSLYSKYFINKYMFLFLYKNK